MSGKASKEIANKKAEKNKKIEEMVMHYYLTEAEMPKYMMEFGNQVQSKYREQFGMMISQFGLLAANLALIEKEVLSSKLSKASKDKIIKLINVSMGANGD